MHPRALLALALLAHAACGAKTDLRIPTRDAHVDARPDLRPDPPCPLAIPPGPVAPAPPLNPPEPGGAPWCTRGADVPGAVVPAGFCLRRFATVGAPRVLAVADDGDVFVAAPSEPTPGGASPGPGAIVVLADDNHDGTAEAHMFASNVRDVHGLALGDGRVYFTTSDGVWQTPRAPGQRVETPAARTHVAALAPSFTARWTHGLARRRDGRLFVSTGVWSGPGCGQRSPAGVAYVADDGAPVTVATGLRNPMYVRCHRALDACLASELFDDGADPGHARDRLLRVRPCTDYGYPCCLAPGRPEPAWRGTDATCASITAADDGFPLHDTPFGLDWERGRWPEPYRGALFVALHGSFYSAPRWQGARVAFAPVDPATGLPREPWRDFVTGFGPAGSPLERPADVAFAPDGRLFLADDHGGAVYWIAPVTLRGP